MEKNPLRIKIGDIQEDKSIEDYPEDTIFVLDDNDPMSEDAYWEDDAINQ